MEMSSVIGWRGGRRFLLPWVGARLGAGDGRAVEEDRWEEDEKEAELGRDMAWQVIGGFAAKTSPEQ